jgi:hypothetical protein
MYSVLTSLATAITSSASTSFWQTLGGRVYVNEAPANVRLPLCVYGVVDHSIEPTFDVDTKRERFTVEFTQYFPHSTGAAAAVFNAERLNVVLDNLELKPSGYDRIVIRAETLGVTSIEDDAVSVSSRFRLEGSRISTTAITA